MCTHPLADHLAHLQEEKENTTMKHDSRITCIMTFFFFSLSTLILHITYLHISDHSRKFLYYAKRYHDIMIKYKMYVFK